MERCLIIPIFLLALMIFPLRCFFNDKLESIMRPNCLNVGHLWSLCVACTLTVKHLLDIFFNFSSLCTLTKLMRWWSSVSETSLTMLYNIDIRLLVKEKRVIILMNSTNDKDIQWWWTPFWLILPPPPLLIAYWIIITQAVYISCHNVISRNWMCSSINENFFSIFS